MYQEAVVEDGSRAVECSGSREEEGQETESHGGNVWRAQWLIQPRVVVWFCAKQCAALRIALHCHLRMRSQMKKRPFISYKIRISYKKVSQCKVLSDNSWILRSRNPKILLFCPSCRSLLTLPNDLPSMVMISFLKETPVSLQSQYIFSFVHCAAQIGSECMPNNLPYQHYSSFFLLFYQKPYKISYQRTLFSLSLINSCTVANNFVYYQSEFSLFISFIHIKYILIVFSLIMRIDHGCH